MTSRIYAIIFEITTSCVLEIRAKFMPFYTNCMTFLISVHCAVSVQISISIIRSDFDKFSLLYITRL
ncbi:hypothetical protein TELCIR_01075 [Teladorsagia circumcincta]|uniref:Uncharacterized protein n=1 Tax=Teladorsagia circumcincta TaxID=45464 RepID=A0A2G9V514_TELCI|nr:hypothetical protein TELCIR_01075 [Teladorsagia circumcincta]